MISLYHTIVFPTAPTFTPKIIPILPSYLSSSKDHCSPPGYLLLSSAPPLQSPSYSLDSRVCLFPIRSATTQSCQSLCSYPSHSSHQFDPLCPAPPDTPLLLVYKLPTSHFAYCLPLPTLLQEGDGGQIRKDCLLANL